MKKLNILNLEDNPNDSELVKEMLEDGGIECEITRVETEEEFRALCYKGGFDIILADYNLPAYDGLSALAIARERCPDTPFIFVSGKMGEDVAVESLKNGATDYLLKNNFNRLASSVLRALKEVEMKIEREKAVNALRESEKYFHDLYDESPAPYQSIDVGGFFIDINRAWLKSLGYSRDEVIGKWFGDFLIPEQQDLHRERFLRFKELGEIHDSEFDMVHKDGTIITVCFEGKVAHDEFGGFKQTHCIFIDVTERKQREEALRKSINGVIQAIALTVEIRDPYTSGHQVRVAKLATMIAREMNLSQGQAEGVGMAAAIHDIGKISVPAEILSKPSRLSDIEYQLIKIHPEAGYNIVKNIDFPWPIATIIIQHHERINGSGYPKGLKCEEILLETRILSVADVVEAIASHRPYRPAYGIDIAIEEISRNRGILYDPDVVDACLRLFNEKGFKFE